MTVLSLVLVVLVAAALAVLITAGLVAARFLPDRVP
jgi:hypothetical protein